ncbi:uncharacterized protein BDW43DRAFT_108708 [Aspergillus alliaceus]|uniref:uncharacterized protein n=1 Tax=Petromyces alliaceus TaxID=209559 RepID=UPI0012A48F28|nr:uncharacterized protein BDW43DRAFT_108708 [Aspergillus alliaceus]KAB8232410.1 hypothetical protein BDW43DRAFT_108708 [Aspergillus alliaceus]
MFLSLGLDVLDGISGVFFIFLFWRWVWGMGFGTETETETESGTDARIPDTPLPTRHDTTTLYIPLNTIRRSIFFDSDYLN